MKNVKRRPRGRPSGQTEPRESFHTRLPISTLDRLEDLARSWNVSKTEVLIILVEKAHERLARKAR